jgi:hypothetical protein
MARVDGSWEMDDFDLAGKLIGWSACISYFEINPEPGNFSLIAET